MTETAISVADWWEPARQRALDDLYRRRRVALDGIRHMEGDPGYGDAILNIFDQFGREKDRLFRPDWVPGRPERKMPSLWTIVQYWEKPGTFDMLITRPACFACGGIAPHKEGDTPAVRWNTSGRYIHRAHLADRCFDGLDAPQNLVPLCLACHDLMPSFRIGTEAVEWVLRGGPPGEPGFRALQARVGMEEGMWFAVKDGPLLMRLWHGDRGRRAG